MTRRVLRGERVLLRPVRTTDADGELVGAIQYGEETTPDYRHANLDRHSRLRARWFRRIGVMREYERADNGTWHDGLLMDLLTSELRS
jgi:hypothetical protein